MKGVVVGNPQFRVGIIYRAESVEVDERIRQLIAMGIAPGDIPQPPPLRVELETQLNRLDVLMGAAPGTYAAELAVPGTVEDHTQVPAIELSQGPADLLTCSTTKFSAATRMTIPSAEVRSSE